MTGNQLAVIGLGYIGLPTAVVFARNGWQVTGVDVSEQTVATVNEGKLPFAEEGLEELLGAVVSSGLLRAATETPKASVYVISVPTPFGENHEADLSHIDAAIARIIPQLEGGELIILESTVPVGTTEAMARRVFAARPDLSPEGFGGRPPVYFAHAPERVFPGRIMIEITQNDRIVGGLTPEASWRAREVYETFCEGTVHETNAMTAELSKLTENSFRDVNIAFANELSMICDHYGIDVWELISLANHHPRVQILNPGPGVGGHCIAVDPWFIVAGDRKNTKLIRTAREVNDSKPRWVLDKVAHALTRRAGEAIAILGLTFKADVDDLRESPAMRIAETVAAEHPEARVLIAEPNIDSLPPKLANYRNVDLVPASEALVEAKVVLLLVSHAPFARLCECVREDAIVIDTTGLWQGART